MKKFVFILLGVLFFITLFRQAFLVPEPIKTAELFYALSDFDISFDTILDNFYTLRDGIIDTIRSFNKVDVPGSDAWSLGDRNILSLLLVIAEVLVDLAFLFFRLICAVVRLALTTLRAGKDILEMIYKLILLFIRLLGLDTWIPK